MMNTTTIPALEAVETAHLRFPPAFDESPTLYALAIWALGAVVFTCLAIIHSFLSERKARQQIHRQVGRLKYSLKEPHQWTLLGWERLSDALILTAIIFGAAPDFIRMVLWNEVPLRVMDYLYTVDTVFDFAFAFPFFAGVALGLVTDQAKTHQLEKADDPAFLPKARRRSPHVSWKFLKEKARIIVITGVIAAVLALAKALV